MSNKKLKVTTLETTMKIMNLDDISINTRILLYYFISIFWLENDNNIYINYKDIYVILSIPKESADVLLLELQLKNYVKIQKANSNVISLTTKTLMTIK